VFLHMRCATGTSGHHLLRGIIAGTLGGLAGALAMNAFQAASSKTAELAERLRAEPEERADRLSKNANQGEPREHDETTEPATVKAAEAVSRIVLGHELEEQEKDAAGMAMHLAMGVTSGAIYGAAAEITPVVTSGSGAPYGLAVWAVADEIVVPALGLSRPPFQHPPSTHLYAMGSHLVYGVVLELTRQTVLAATE
jgi:hypothetical protein